MLLYQGKGEKNSPGGESADAAAAFGGRIFEDGDELMFKFEDDVETGTLKKNPKPATTPYNGACDFEEIPYIHHLMDGDGATSSHGKLAARFSSTTTSISIAKAPKTYANIVHNIVPIPNHHQHPQNAL